MDSKHRMESSTGISPLGIEVQTHDSSSVHSRSLCPRLTNYWEAHRQDPMYGGRWRDIDAKWFRWLQLVCGIICMIFMSNLQYAWTLFVDPIHDRYGWDKASIQVTFTILVVFETWSMPFEGLLIDRVGPQLVVCLSGVLVGLSWLINSAANHLGWFYFSAAIGGLGAAGVYGGAIGNALKWFPDKRGLAAGLTAAGFGAGSAVTIVPIANTINHSGYKHAFLTFGLIQGIVITVVALFLRAPKPAEDIVTVPSPDHPPQAPCCKLSPLVAQHVQEFPPDRVLRQLVFWIMYFVFVLASTGGLMLTAELGPIAEDNGIEDALVTIAGITLTTLTFALALDRIFNGIARPLSGLLSDYLGREILLTLAFVLEGVGFILFLNNMKNAKAFVLITGCVFFAWGEVYSIFPACITDTFGKRYAASNYGLLYTAKGIASILVPIASAIKTHYGSWTPVLVLCCILSFLAAFLCFFVVRPLRYKFISNVLERNAAVEGNDGVDIGGGDTEGGENVQNNDDFNE